MATYHRFLLSLSGTLTCERYTNGLGPVTLNATAKNVRHIAGKAEGSPILLRSSRHAERIDPTLVSLAQALLKEEVEKAIRESGVSRYNWGKDLPATATEHGYLCNLENRIGTWADYARIWPRRAAQAEAQAAYFAGLTVSDAQFDAARYDSGRPVEIAAPFVAQAQ